MAVRKKKRSEDLHDKGATQTRRSVRKGKPVESEDLQNDRETPARRRTVGKGKPVETEDLQNKRGTQARRCTKRKAKPFETEDLHNKRGTKARVCTTTRKGKPGETGALHNKRGTRARRPVRKGKPDETASATAHPHEDLAPSVSISSSSEQCVESRLEVKMTSPDPDTDVVVKEEPEDHWDITSLSMAEEPAPLEEQGPLSEGSDIEGLDGDGSFEQEYGTLDQSQWMRVVLVKDEEEDVGEFQADWRTDDYQPSTKREFNRQPGVRVELPDNATPLEVFSKIFTEQLFLRLVTETNAYAQQSRSGTPETSRNKWTPVTVMEMRTFLGLCIAMGILQLPARRDYWRQTKGLFQTNLPQVMSRDRFTMIWRYLHLQDNHADDVDRSDKLWKMRWFLDYLSCHFQSLYEVNGFVTVDETPVRFGRCHPKQTKHGVRVWVMAESTTGYVTNFQVCPGAGLTQDKAAARRLVMDLAMPYYGSHLSIFMDNTYSGVELFQEMKRHGLNACGDVRSSNRCGLLRNQKTWLGQPEVKMAQKDDLTLCVWQDDAKTITVLSNYHDPTEKGSVKRRKAGSSKQTEVVVPACISDYQKHVKGADLLEQMVGYYQFQHRSQKWWRRLFFFFLSVACYNGYIAAKSVGGKPFTVKYRGYKDWLEDLAQQLTVPVVARSAPQYSSSSAGPPEGPPQGPPASEHDFEKIFDKRKKCRVCSVDRYGTDTSASATTYGCRQCHEALHIQCFGKHVRQFL